MAEQKTRLSRADMEETIKGGGSVLLDGRIVTNVADLPNPEELAETEEEREVTAEDLRRQRDELDARLAAMESARQPNENWKKADLVALAEERGLDSSGTVRDLVERLSAAAE